MHVMSEEDENVCDRCGGFPDVSTLLGRADIFPFFMSEERGFAFL